MGAAYKYEGCTGEALSGVEGGVGEDEGECVCALGEGGGGEGMRGIGFGFEARGYHFEVSFWKND